MNLDLFKLTKYYWNEIDICLTKFIGSTSITLDLLTSPWSKYITESIIITSIVLIIYELIYWTGIHFKLWEYHAKDIFTEVPVHCAHVYVRLNVSNEDKSKKLDEYYELKQNSKYNILNWKCMSDKKDEAFINEEFIKYHFEFSPEDFEMNEEPEFGSTISHLRSKILDLFKSSKVFAKFVGDQNLEDVLIFNKHSEKITSDKDNEYLVRCSIETGDIIDCIIMCP